MARAPVYSALPAAALHEITEGLFIDQAAMPPNVRTLCAFVGRHCHVRASAVLAHMLPIVQSLLGPAFVRNDTYDTMVRACVPWSCLSGKLHARAYCSLIFFKSTCSGTDAESRTPFALTHDVVFP